MRILPRAWQVLLDREFNSKHDKLPGACLAGEVRLHSVKSEPRKAVGKVSLAELVERAQLRIRARV